MKKKIGWITLILALFLLIAFLQTKLRVPSAPSEHGTNAIQPRNEPRESEVLVPSPQPTIRSQTPVQKQLSKPSVLTEEHLAKARSQAKIQLAVGYGALKSFEAEYHRYTTDLKAAGFSPNQALLPYKFGFMRPFNALEPADFESLKEIPGRMNSDELIGELSDQEKEPYRYSQDAQNLNFWEFSRYCEIDCTATENTFEMLLVYPLGEDGRVDVWRINEKKEVVLVHDGMVDAPR